MIMHYINEHFIPCTGTEGEREKASRAYPITEIKGHFFNPMVRVVRTKGLRMLKSYIF